MSTFQDVVTLDNEGRVASIETVDGDSSIYSSRFDYPDVARLRLPDLAQVTTRSSLSRTSVDPATGYWTVQEPDSADGG